MRVPEARWALFQPHVLNFTSLHSTPTPRHSIHLHTDNAGLHAIQTPWHKCKQGATSKWSQKRSRRRIERRPKRRTRSLSLACSVSARSKSIAASCLQGFRELQSPRRSKAAPLHPSKYPSLRRPQSTSPASSSNSSASEPLIKLALSDLTMIRSDRRLCRSSRCQLRAPHGPVAQRTGQPQERS